MRKLIISVAAALVLGAVAPLTAGAGAPGVGTIEFVTIGGTDSPPTDVNGNGILDAGDYLIVDDTLQVTGSSVVLVPVGTIATLEGELTLESFSVVRATLRLSLPNGSLRVFGSFSASVFEGSGEVFDLSAVGETGIFSGTSGQIRVSPGETTTFLLTLSPAGGAGGIPASCDPQLLACASIADSPDEPLLAPSSSGDGGAAMGQPRMPDLRGRLSATWNGSALTVHLRVIIRRPKLAKPFDVEIRGQDFTRTIRVLPRGRTSVLIQLTLPLSHTPSGKVIARIDPEDAVIETRERNNTPSARVR